MRRSTASSSRARRADRAATAEHTRGAAARAARHTAAPARDRAPGLSRYPPGRHCAPPRAGERLRPSAPSARSTTCSTTATRGGARRPVARGLLLSRRAGARLCAGARRRRQSGAPGGGGRSRPGPRHRVRRRARAGDGGRRARAGAGAAARPRRRRRRRRAARARAACSEPVVLARTAQNGAYRLCTFRRLLHIGNG